MLVPCSQDRNVSKLMYGGYLLKEAFELAYATATLHASKAPQQLDALLHQRFDLIFQKYS